MADQHDFTAAGNETGGRRGAFRAGTAVSLALQGGGSFGAFTWGVLDRLLEEDGPAFDTVSGVSAGAVNAAVLASGYARGGRAGARERLERFWRRASGTAPSSPVSHALALSSRMFSPYQLNPFDLSPLRRLLQTEVDFELIRANPSFRLMVGATRVADGSLRLFGSGDLTLDVLMASTCLPLLAQAITIDGDDYWDGGYAANPPLLPLIEASASHAILVVRIIPTHGDAHPRSAGDITRRLDGMAFNASLTRDLELLETMKTLVGPAGGQTATGHKLVDCVVHVVSAEDLLPGLGEGDALNLDWSFLRTLRDAGRRAGAAWLAGTPPVAADAADQSRPSPEAQSASSPWRYVG